MPDRERWRLAAPAKAEPLAARRRPPRDGFHELESLLVLLELADVVSVGLDGRDVWSSGPRAAEVPADRTNLAWRGWISGQGGEAGNPPGGLAVDKQIPVAAGLGGGSSDAAAPGASHGGRARRQTVRRTRRP